MFRKNIFSVPLFVSEQTQTVSIEPVNSENTDLQAYHDFTAFITAMSQQQPHFTLKDVRGMLANQFKIFDSRFDFLFDSNGKATGYSFDGVTFDKQELVEWMTSYSTA